LESFISPDSVFVAIFPLNLYLFAPDPVAAHQAVLQMIPMAELGKVEDVAHMVRFLASKESGYCTGSEFVVDGGMTAT